MSFFSRLTKSNSSEKTVYPWSRRKLTGNGAALPRFGHGVITLDDQCLLIYGGRHKGNIKRQLFLLDTNTMSAYPIQTTGDIPSPRAFATVLLADSLVLLFGGEPIVPGESWDPELYILHTHSKEWSKIKVNGNSPSVRSGHTMSVYNSCIYVWGGRRQGQYLNDMFAFDLKGYPAKSEWLLVSQKNQIPAPRSGHISVIYDAKLYIFGGTNANHLYNDIWYFDLNTRVWNKVEAAGYIPAPREGCSAALMNDTIYIFGGIGLNGFALDDLCAFRIKSKRWYTFQNMGSPPSARHGTSLTLHRNMLFVYGGHPIHGKMEDESYIYMLDCSKIKYPPENEIPEHETKQPEKLRQPLIILNEPNDTLKLDKVNGFNTTSKLEIEKSQSAKDIHRKARSNSNHKPGLGTPPPRPPREGATLYTAKQPPSFKTDEKSKLLMKIAARDAVISKIKKKEQWWRTEVSIARHMQNTSIKDNPQDIKLFELKENDTVLLKQLTLAKAEIRKMKNNMERQTESTVQNLARQQSIRVSAVEEAAYYKYKYTFLKSRNQTELALLEADRIEILERRLQKAHEERNRIKSLLLETQKQSQCDKTSRLLAEERASIAQKRSEMTHEAHQSTLGKLSGLYSQVLKTETKCREDAIKIANLSNELANQLSKREGHLDLSKMHIQEIRLEAAHIKSRNEISVLSKELEAFRDQKDELESILAEKDYAYAEALLELEKVRIETELLKLGTEKKDLSDITSGET